MTSKILVTTKNLWLMKEVFTQKLKRRLLK